MRGLIAAGLALGLSGVAFTQGYTPVATAQQYSPGQTLGNFTLAKGDIIIVNGKENPLTGANAVALSPLDDVQIKRFNKATGTYDPPVRVKQKGQITLGVFPLAVFTFSGALGNNGGTMSFPGVITALSYSHKLGRQSYIDVGGFYYWEFKHRDIYGLETKMFFTPEFGGQIDYLNTKNGEAPAVTTFFLYNLSSTRVAPQSRLPWNVVLGVGAYWNLSNFFRASSTPAQNQQLNLVPRQSVNFTYYLNASLTLSKKVSIIASQWYIRDRNAELNRFAIGLAFRF